MSIATIELHETATTATGRMDVLEAIQTRRSVKKLLPDQPSRADIEQILEAATWAPCHHVTEPWRFVVISGQARETLGDLMARQRTAGIDPASRETTVEYTLMKKKAFRAPVIVAVGVEPNSGPSVVEREEVAAGAAAIQNMLLAAHALGLAAIWRTGDPVDDPAIKAFLGFTPSTHIIGFVYLGYPAVIPDRDKHTSAADVTRWLGWEDEIHATV